MIDREKSLFDPRQFLFNYRYKCFIVRQGDMSKVPTSTLAAVLAFSIISLIGSLATSVLVFALNYSGFNFGAATIGCNGQTYFGRRWTYIYLAYRTHTITGLICVCLAIIALIIAAKLYCPLKDISEEALQKQVLDKTSVGALYILSAFQVLCAISFAGGKISIVILNNYCTMTEKTNLYILLAASVLALLGVLLQMVMVIVLCCRTEEPEPISLNDVKGNDVTREQDAISKHLEMQMKEYFSNSHNKKEEMMEGLLKRDEDVYGGIGAMTQFNPTSDQPPMSAFPVDQPQAASNNPNNPNQTGKKNQKQGKGKKKKKRNVAQQMHKYHTAMSPQDNGGGQYYGENQDDNEDSQAVSEELINQELLHAKFDDNLSQKFDENNFQLEYDLNRAIASDKEEDLSPLQLKQLMRLTQASFALKSTDQRGLHLEKSYQIPEGFKININFVQVKDHKQKMRQQIQRLIDNPNPTLEDSKRDEKQVQKKIVEQQDKPVSQQTAKLLKVILFNNSEFYKKPEQKQTQCPISKYVDHDDGFQIIQSNQKEGKTKRFDYSKEQLLFSKKRKDDNEEVQNEKGRVRQEFNEVEFVKMERRAIFGDDWINQYDKKQEKTNKKSARRSLVQVIRSKYYG